LEESWRPKPADKVVRPSRIKPYRLRRVMGIPGLFSIGYGDVGSSIYFALGVIAFIALGATPIALGIAGIIYIFNALTYAEGSAMVPEGGGSANYARLAFNDFIGFSAGWLVMLVYIVTVAIAAYTIPPYLSYFWPVLSEIVPGTLTSIGIVILLMLVNFVGIGEWSGLNIIIVTIDIVVLIALIVLGTLLLFVPGPSVLYHNMFDTANWPTIGNLIFGIGIAALCFTGVESIAQHAEEAKRPEKKMPQTYMLMVVTALILFAGISLTALTAMTPQQLGDPVNGWARHPVAGIASAVSNAIIPDQITEGILSETMRTFLNRILTYTRDWLPGLVSILACTVLVMATNTGILGMTRLAYNLSKHRQLPASMGSIHRKFRTPYLAVVIFGLVSVIMLLPGLLSRQYFMNLAALYVFGALLVFASAHISILRLRMIHPDRERPFRLLGNIKIRGSRLPVTAVLGLLSTIIIWLIVVITHPFIWWVGIVWLLVGFLVYYSYRKSHHLPLWDSSDNLKRDK
jgi:basic amino acid/polyamine antiporter, APA family